MSLSYRLNGSSLFLRENEGVAEPERVVFLSVEGNKTEVNYFNFIEKYKHKLGIKAVVHIEVLRRKDTNSDPENVLELLEEYIQIRNSNNFKGVIQELLLNKYDSEYIEKYLKEPSCIPDKERKIFESDLRNSHVDLLYLNFLSKYHGARDVFCVVLDRDHHSHSEKQMNSVIKKCREKSYQYFVSNPCFEFWLLLHVSDVHTEFSDSLDLIKNNALDSHGNSYVSNLLFDKTGQRKAIQKKVFEKFYLNSVDIAIERSKYFAGREQLLTEIGTNIGELIDLLREKHIFSS